MSFRQEILEKRQAFRVYIPLVILYFLSYFQRTSLPGTIFDTLSADLHLNASGMAALAASFVYPYAVCQIFSGALVDRFCGTRVVMAGGAVMLAGILLFPLSASLPMLCAARALTGIGSSTIFLALVRETDRLFGRKNYALIFGIAYFCGYAGGLSGTLPFERLCAAYPWRHVLFGAAAVTAAGYLALLGAGLRSKMPPVPDTPFSLKPYRNVIANPLSWRMILCANVNFCIFFVIQTVFGKKFLQDFAGLSSAVSAGVIFAMTLVCMGIMLTTSILSRLTGNRRRPLILGACGVTLLGTLLMVSAIRLRLPGWSFAAAYILFSAGAGIPQIFSMRARGKELPVGAFGRATRKRFVPSSCFRISSGIPKSSVRSMYFTGAPWSAASVGYSV